MQLTLIKIGVAACAPFFILCAIGIVWLIARLLWEMCGGIIEWAKNAVREMCWIEIAFVCAGILAIFGVILIQFAGCCGE